MKRNYGIDLLRMILMLMVVVLHVLGHGGVLGATSELSMKNNAMWLMEAFAYCAVNCYALITGYVHINSRYKFSSFIQIFLQTVLYSLGIAICVCILRPQWITVDILRRCAFPVSSRYYWYVSAYFGLFILIPFLNAAINAFAEKQAKWFLGLGFFVFSVLPTFAREDIFSVGAGYSTFWLAYMYVIGACIKKFGWGEQFKSHKAILIYVGSVVVSWGLKIAFGSITARLLGEPKKVFDFITYTSPTMVIAAAALFLAFKNVTVSPKLTGVIAQFAPAAFGVYLIHEHELVKWLIMQNKYGFLTNFSAPVMVVGVLVIALAIFTGCLLIDWVRCKVFKWLRIKERLEKLEDKCIHFNITSIK